MRDYFMEGVMEGISKVAGTRYSVRNGVFKTESLVPPAAATTKPAAAQAAKPVAKAAKTVATKGAYKYKAPGRFMRRGLLESAGKFATRHPVGMLGGAAAIGAGAGLLLGGRR